MDLDFTADLPRWWLGGGQLPTQLANGMNLVFPAGERFFIRSVQHYAGQVRDPALRQRVTAFAAQEAHHQRAHQAAFAMLQAQGYEVEGWLRWYEELGYRVIEPRTSPAFRLATTAALEHLTAIFGELALGTEMLDLAHPTMQTLLRWHAAEEIEHRAVAFEVFEEVDGRWWVRVAGMGMALGTLGFFWFSGTRHLLRGDGALGAPRSEVPPPSAAEARGVVLDFWRRNGPRALRRLGAWFRPGFHPDHAAIDHLAEAWLSAAGRLAG